MSKEFEAEVKKVKPVQKPAVSKPRQPTHSERAKDENPSEKEDSPLKTPGGTPIIERPPEG